MNLLLGLVGCLDGLRKVSKGFYLGEMKRVDIISKGRLKNSRENEECQPSLASQSLEAKAIHEARLLPHSS